MKKIDAIIRPFKLEAIKTALVEENIVGMTVSDVLGYGQQGHNEQYKGSSFVVDLVSKIKIELVVSNEDYLNKAIEIIKKHSQTGKNGDGKIFVYDVEKVVRIRTNEKNEEALK